VILLVFIAYDNGGSGPASYTYEVNAIPQSEYKMMQLIPDTNVSRQTIDRHGIKFVFIITGQIGKFDFQVALVQLVSALGLLSVATLAVELCMLYLLPERKLYFKYKFEDTADFSDVRDAQEQEKHDEHFHAQIHGELADLRVQPSMDF